MEPPSHEPAAVQVSTVSLELMPQQADAKSSLEDWTGVTNRVERKKRQNRLHQRAHRPFQPPFILLGCTKLTNRVRRDREEKTCWPFFSANLEAYYAYGKWRNRR